MGPMTSHLLKVLWLIVDYACNTLAFKLTQILCVPQYTVKYTELTAGRFQDFWRDED
jgi:hypothetical protein